MSAHSHLIQQFSLDWESYDQFEAYIVELRELAEQSEHGKAALLLSHVLSPNSVLDDQWKRAIGASNEQERRYQQLAVRFLRRESDLGDAESTYDLANCYQRGVGGVARDPEKWVALCEQALELGYSFAANDLYSAYSTRDGPRFDADRAAEMAAILSKSDVQQVVDTS